jgi:hypothetical protein
MLPIAADAQTASGEGPRASIRLEPVHVAAIAGEARLG